MSRKPGGARREKVLGFGFPFKACWSSNSTRRPRTFDWTHDPAAATVETVVCIGLAIQKELNRKGRKIAWVLESPAIAQWQHTTTYISNNLQQVMDAYEFVLASDRAFCEMHPRIVYHPAGSNLPWISEEQYGIYRKTRMCSMFATSKKMVETQLIRQGFAEKFKNKLDLFGGAAGSPRIGGKVTHPDKSAGMIPYRFQVVMENCRADFYYTEKITDCFATGTVPVYWGSECIGELFDSDGIIVMDDSFDPDSLNENMYWSMMPAIRNNLEIVRQLEGTDDMLFRKFIRTSGSVSLGAAAQGDGLPWHAFDSMPNTLPLSKDAFDEAKHLDIVCKSEKMSVSRLDQVPPEMLIIRTVRSVLEKPRTAFPDQQPGKWHPDIRQSFLLQLPDAYIGDNVVFDHQRYYGFKRWWAGSDWKSYANTERVTHIESGLLASAWCGNNFQHFMLDVMPALSATIDLLEQPEYKHVKIVSHINDAEFAKWFWHKLGLTSRVVQKPHNTKEGRVIHADQVLFWCFEPGLNSIGLYPRYSLKPLQERLGIFSTGQQDQVLYLGRPLTRSVANEDAVIAILKECLSGSGLHLHEYRSSANWQQDLEVFSRAKIVIGPHGGALANMVFCRPGTHVVEFVAPLQLEGNNSHLVYYGMAQAAGHHYWFTEPQGFGLAKPNMVVNEQDVKSILSQILSM